MVFIEKVIIVLLFIVFMGCFGYGTIGRMIELSIGVWLFLGVTIGIILYGIVLFSLNYKKYN